MLVVGFCLLRAVDVPGGAQGQRRVTQAEQAEANHQHAIDRRGHPVVPAEHLGEIDPAATGQGRCDDHGEPDADGEIGGVDEGDAHGGSPRDVGPAYLNVFKSCRGQARCPWRATVILNTFNFSGAGRPSEFPPPGRR